MSKVKNENCGIYAIINKVNCKMYIGSSKDIKQRINKHFRQLRNGKHKNSYLQSSWNKYGESNFEFKIIEECVFELLLKKEQYYINYYNTTNKWCGYNLKLKANSSGIMSEETKKKLSEKSKGKRPSDLCIQRSVEVNKNRVRSEEELKRISMRNKGRKQSKEHVAKRLKSRESYVVTEETREKMRISATGRKHTEESKEKCKTFLGKKHTEETKKKISQSKIGNTAWLGKKHSEESKAKISQTKKNKNFKHSEDAKEKMRIASQKLWQNKEWRKKTCESLKKVRKENK